MKATVSGVFEDLKFNISQGRQLHFWSDPFENLNLRSSTTPKTVAFTIPWSLKNPVPLIYTLARGVIRQARKLPYINFQIPYNHHYNSVVCIFFASFFKTISLFSRRFFHKILSLCLFSIQERIMMACLWYVNPISTRMGRLCPPIGLACLKNVLITPLPVSFFCALTTRRRCLWESVVLRYLTNFLCNLDSRLEPTNFCCF